MAWTWCRVACFVGLVVIALAPGMVAQPHELLSLQSGIHKNRNQKHVMLQSERGIAVVMPLELVATNSSSQHPSVKRERELLGNARIDLHDDLLTKGYYTSRIRIGTPPHEFALIVDTGSTVTYVPCSSCTHCGHHQDPRFSPDSSSSYRPLGCGSECQTGFCDGNSHCKYERQYAEMSTSSGVLGKDLVSFSNSSDLGTQQIIFGCETVETGDLFYQTADGIMGLGRGSLSIIDQLVKQNAMADSFSLCYGGMDVGGGAMILGGFVPPPSMVFTHSDPHRSPYYNLMLKEIRVAGTPLPVKPEVFNGKYGTVLDSGTTYAYFPDAAFTAFKDVVKQHLGKLQEVAGPDPNFKDICYAGAGTDTSKLSQFFPSVDFVFGAGESVALTPENYLFRHTKVPGAYCLGVFKNGKDPTTLLGGIIVRNMLVTYDRAKEKIGFWKTNCNDLWNLLPSSFPPPANRSIDTGHSTQPGDFFAAPSPAPHSDSGSAHNTGAIEISMLLDTNYSTFSKSTAEFLEDIVRELNVPLNQVRILNFTAAGGDIFVHWVVFPADVDNQQLNTTAERIISRLKHHEVHLSEVFGVYNLTSWRVIPFASKQSGTQNKMVAAAVVAACILLITATGLIIYWQLWRFRNKHSYETLDKSMVEGAGVQLQSFEPTDSLIHSERHYTSKGLREPDPE